MADVFQPFFYTNLINYLINLIKNEFSINFEVFTKFSFLTKTTRKIEKKF